MPSRSRYHGRTRSGGPIQSSRFAMFIRRFARPARSLQP